MMFSKKILHILTFQFSLLTCCVLNLHATVREVAYLQTDRTVYIAGEPVFYKLYVLDEATHKYSDISKVGYIQLRAANAGPAIKVRVEVNAGISSGSFLLPDTLSSGVYQVVAFTGFMKNVGEQQFFSKEIVIANRYDKDLNFKLINPTNNGSTQQQDSVIKIKTDKSSYGPREKVKVVLGKTNLKANIAVSVYESLPQVPSIEKNIVTTLSESLSGSNDKTITNDYLPETRAKIIRGKVIDLTTQKTVSEATVLLSCPDTIANLQYAKTNVDGKFQMLLNGYYAGKNLFFTIKDMPVNQQWRLVIEDEFLLSDKWKPTLNQDNNLKDFIQKSKKIVYINKSYKLNDDLLPAQANNPQVICPKVYNCSVNSVFPSDFVSLKDFSEIAVELLPMVKINKRDNKFTVRVINEAISSPFQQEPAIFLDGVYVDDLTKIMSLGSEVIKKIDVFSTERVYGDLTFQGLISVSTNSNEILKLKPALNSLRFKNDTINRGKDFLAINPDSIANKNTPFLKQLLFWNPQLQLNPAEETSFEFYTSDNTSNFCIKVEGISEDGTPLSAISTIQVINKINTSGQ